MTTAFAYQEEPKREPARAQPFVAHRLDETRAQIDHELSQIEEQVYASLVGRLSEAMEEITREVWRGVLGAPGERAIDALRSLDVPTHDVEGSYEELKSQVEADRYQGGLPCLLAGEGRFIPVAEPLSTDGDFHMQAEVNVRPTEAAVGGFCDELKPFLANRVAAKSWFPRMRDFFGGMSQTPLNLPVRVFSPTTGARVSCSPAYFINYVSFAAPTSPAASVLLPGRYIFMISTRQGRQFDQGVFDIPPTFDVQLLV
jgi:hypothetical protein